MLYKQRVLLVYIIASITCLFSFMVGIGWVFDYTSILSIIPNGATMKFNTALSFFLTSIALFILFKEQKKHTVLRLSIATIVLAIGLFSLIEYFIGLNSSFDNLFINDTNTSLYPGRMSPATSFCFMLIGISFWGINNNKLSINKLSQHLILTVTIISFVSTVTFILSVPSENKTLFWNSMALHTSILLLITSIGLSFKNSKIGFISLITGSLTGSKFIRFLLPYLIVLPTSMSYILIILINKNQTYIEFGIAIFTTIFIVFSIVFISVIAIKENTNDLYRKTLEASLKSKNNELEQYVSIATHDLKEPLNSVKGLINLLELQSNSKLDNEEKQYLTHISNSIERMSSLIKELSVYSNVGQNKTLSTINFNMLINECIADLNSLIKTKNAIITVDDLPFTLKGYQTELRLVFQNLITNALKFCKKGTIPSIHISADQQNNFVVFSVKDNGIGIAAEHKDEIFSIFKRLHSKKEYDGSGIGLAHCYKIITLHKGEIWVESEVGQGSTFFFTLPNNA